MKYNMVKLKELCTVNQGLQIPISKRYKEPGENRYFYITVQFLKDNGENYYIENPPKSVTCTENEILVVRTGNTGQVITGVAGCFHNNFFKVTPNEKIYFKYLYYALNNKKMHDAMLNAASGTTIPDLKHSSFYDLEIPLPEISIQKKIAKILDNICDKLKLNNEINNNLYEMCNVLYHQLLDDNESNIEYKTIGEIAKKVITGKTPSTKNKEYWGGNIPFITIPDMHNQVFTINTERYITKEGAKSLIPKNSISVSCIATVGLVSINDKDSQTNQQINSIVIENDYDLYYLFEFLTEQEQYMKSIAGGSTTYNINKNTFENIQVPYLNKELIIEYDKKVRPMFEKIKSNQISNDTLSQLRDILLPKLMNGEIDLDNIEI